MEKKFKNMNQAEICALSDEEFAAIDPFEKRSCCDCDYLTPAITWWCFNEEAKKARGTSIPGCIKCPFWEPTKKLAVSKWYKLVYSQCEVLVTIEEFEDHIYAKQKDSKEDPIDKFITWIKKYLVN